MRHFLHLCSGCTIRRILQGVDTLEASNRFLLEHVAPVVLQDVNGFVIYYRIVEIQIVVTAFANFLSPIISFAWEIHFRGIEVVFM